MKKFTIYFLLLLPCLAFGQMFPKIPDFKGNVRKIVEKKYGREVSFLGLFPRVYRSSAASGWEYTYDFDTNSQLVKRSELFRNKVKMEYIYHSEKDKTHNVVREIVASNSSDQVGNYQEYENFTDDSGRIEKVNYWVYNAKTRTRELYLIEDHAQYRDNKLVSFVRSLMNEKGEQTSSENCTLSYDESGKLIQLERNDPESGFQTIINYSFNAQGWVSHYSVDLLAEIQEPGKSQLIDIYYTYDQQGNWTRMYWKSGNEYRLESKRTIQYQ